MTNNTGGPASPLHVNDEPCRARLESGYGGMTLRDYFAAKAMQSMVSCEFGEAFRPDNWAEYAYKMADAMLKERSK